eukprot:3358373-Pyramimonas_sp.AAC.1
MGRKVKRVTDKLINDDSRVAFAVTLALSCKPIDDLVLELMQRDGSRVLADVAGRRANPVRRCQRELVRVLTHGLVPETVAQFFPLALDGKKGHMATMRSCVLSMSASVHYRLDCRVDSYPYRLLKIVHPELTSRDRLAAAEEFYRDDTRACCMDAGMSNKLRETYPSAAALMRSEAALGCLRAWMDLGRITVSVVERLHAQNKASFTPDGKTRRHVEGA